MKKVIISLTLATIFFTAVKAQDERKNVIKINPVGLLFGSANVAYERAFSEKSSFVIAPTFGSFTLGDFKYSSLGISAEYRQYLSSEKPAPLGMYVSPGIGYTSGKLKNNSGDEAKFGAFVIKGVFGRQWIWDSGFTIDLNGGIQYLNYSYSNNSGAAFAGLKASGVLPALGFSVGYAF